MKMENWKEKINEDLVRNIEALCQNMRSNGFECWMVGGAVRDLISDKVPKDFDFATNARPEHVQKIFNKTIPTGIDHGTITVMVGGEPFELTTFRKDVDTDGRRATVEFAEKIEDDLSRRDFTINAIAFDPLSGVVVDPFNGVEAVKNRELRFVGDPATRIKEDHLRALRWVRFMARGFNAPRGDFKVVFSTFKEGVLSRERINMEMESIFKSIGEPRVEIAKAFFADVLIDLGVFKKFFGRKAVDEIVFGQAIIRAVDALSLVPIADEIARRHGIEVITEELKMSNDLKDRVILFQELNSIGIDKMSHAKNVLAGFVKILHNKAEAFVVFRELMEMKARINPGFSHFKLGIIQEMVKEVEVNNEPFLIQDLDIKGNEIMEMGFKGPEIGEKLESLRRRIVDNPELNSNSILRSLI